MNRLLIVLIFLCCGNIHSQDLENEIYATTEIFNKTKTETSLNSLDQKILEFTPKINTKDEHFAFINLLLNKAYYLDKNNRQQKAITTYEDAWTRYKKEKIAKIFQYDIIEYCLIPLGILYHKTNNYTNAENTIKHYIFLAEKQQNNTHRASGAINLSNLYQKLGKHQLAIDIASKGLKIPKLPHQQKRKLKSIQSRSSILLDKTIAYIDNVDVNLPNLMDLHIKTQMEYELAYKARDYKKALKLLKNKRSFGYNKMASARDLAKLNIEEAHLHLLLSDKNTSAKKLKQALRTLLPNFEGHGLPKKNELYPENTFIDLFDALADLQDNPKNALECYELSFYVSSLLEREITSQEGKLIQLSNNRKRSEKCIFQLHKLNKTSDNATYIEQAFAYAERFKSSVLKEIVSKKSLLETYPKDTLLIKEQLLLKKQTRLTNQLVKTPYTPLNKEKQNIIREALNSVSIQLKKIKNDINEKYGITKDNLISFYEIQRRLIEDDATLVEYFYGNDIIYQFIISGKAAELNIIKLNEITKNEILKFIGYFDNPSIINNNVSKYTLDAFSLYETLLFNKVRDKKNIIVIPDGFINFIPFDALLTSKTKSLNFETMPFLVKKHKLAYNSSAALYLRQNKPSSQERLLGVFPVFENSNQELSYSIDEAKSIEKEMRSTVLMNNFATKENFMELANDYDILHFSTHANGGDFIEPASIKFVNSTMSLNELYELNLNIDLVVLSACETGIGSLKQGEGAMSLARGFQYAGAKNMLFSLWKINDRSTSQVISYFYENHNESKSAFLANCKSKLDYLYDRNIKNIKKSPYYWSTFVFYGDLTKPEKSNYIYLSIIVISILIAVLLLLLFKKQYEKRTSRVLAE